MKIRTSFVSNSSSSSFIIGLAKIENRGMWKTQFPCEENDWADSEDKPWFIIIKNIDLDKMTCDLTIDDIFSNAITLSDVKYGQEIIYLNESTEQDEDILFYDEEYGEYDYSVDLDDFSADDVNIYNQISELDGVNDYGAGRDG